MDAGVDLNDPCLLCISMQCSAESGMDAVFLCAHYYFLLTRKRRETLKLM